MTSGQTRYADITALVPDVQTESLMTMTEQNLLVATIKVFRNTSGMAPRKVNKWPGANPRSVAEGEDVTSTKFTKTALATLTPGRTADQFFITDEDFETDPEDVGMAASDALGASFAEDIDKKIAGLFSSLTGGTVGSAGGTPNWSWLFAARAKLQQLKVRPPYVCTLGAGMWYHIVNAGGSANSSPFMRHPSFQDTILKSYFVNNLFDNVIFAVTANVTGGAGGTAYGAMYGVNAMAYDERRAFRIRPQRDESRGGDELNASIEYGYGTWDADQGVQIIATDVVPAT